VLASRSDTEGRCSGASPAPRRAGRVRSQPRHSLGAAAPPVSPEELAPLRVRADGCRSKLPVRQLCAGLSASALPLACPRRVRPASPPMGTRPARAGALVLPWGCADGRRPTTPLTHLRSALNAFATSQLPSRFGHRSTVIGCCSRASPAGAASGPAPPSRRSTGLPRPNHFPPRGGEGGARRREPVTKWSPAAVRPRRLHRPETRRRGRSPREDRCPRGATGPPRR